MAQPPGDPPRVETREISDADAPPKMCPQCSSPEYTRCSYHFRDLQDLGEPGVIRRVRYEAVYWKCSRCGQVFRVKHAEIEDQGGYTRGVVAYAVRRVLKKGDPTRRVVEDLNELHLVQVTEPTVASWIRDAGNGGDSPAPEDSGGAGVIEDFSGVMGLDATFRSVKAKKNEPRGGENAPSTLYLTRREDGRLEAYWHEGKPRPRRAPRSRR